jgi:catechol 2,3-dioxygenase-like lactoylglutathione lyase family enzyme
MFDQQVTFLTVKDLEKSIQFYQGLLGLALVLDQGACKIYQVSKTGFIGICAENSHMKATKDGVIFTLVSDDVDDCYERLSAKGVTFEKAPAENPKFDIYHCFLRDPDGHLLEIQRFNDPAWPKPGEIRGDLGDVVSKLAQTL